MEFLALASQRGRLQPFLAETLPAGVLEASLGGLTVREALRAFMTGHGEFYAGLVFILFVLYVPNGLLGTLRARYGDHLAAVVARRLGRSDDAGD